MASSLGIDDLLEWSRSTTISAVDPHQTLCSMLRTAPHSNSERSVAQPAEAGHQGSARSTVGLGSQQLASSMATDSGGSGDLSFTVPRGGIRDGEAVEKEEVLTAKKEKEIVDLTSEGDQETWPSSHLPPLMTLEEVTSETDLHPGFPLLQGSVDRLLPRGFGTGGETFPFPPSPPKSGGLTGWLPSFRTPQSPLRALIRPAMNWFSSPHKNGSDPKSGGRAKRALEEVPEEVPVVGKGKMKHKGKWVRSIALAMRNSKGLMKEFDEQFSSSTSRAPKNSRRKLVSEVLGIKAGGGDILPLSAGSLKHLAATLWKSGYSSAELYIVEAKLMHVEEGYEWTSQLDLMMKRCKRGVSRNLGPRKKANEVSTEKRHRARSCSSPAKSPIHFPKELFFFAMVWMLRGIELVRLLVSDVTVNASVKTVTLFLRTSKTDQRGKGVSRVLSCVCSDSQCHPECPYFISVDLLAKLSKLAEGNKHLFVPKNKRLKDKKARRNQLIRAWSLSFDMKVTGHSARRTGALNYIRMGWAISQVAFLGRWASSVIYSYAQEALESLAVNANAAQFLRQESSFTKDGKQWDGNGMEEENVGEDSKIHIQTLELEVAEFKRDSKKATESLKKEVKYLKENFGSKRDGPPRVQGLRSKLIHDNSTPVTSVPPCFWKTKCGWNFRGGDFCFVAAEAEITCLKCLGLPQNALSQRGEDGIL